MRFLNQISISFFFFISIYLCRVLRCSMISREKWEEVWDLRTAEGHMTSEKNWFENFFAERAIGDSWELVISELPLRDECQMLSLHINGWPIDFTAIFDLPLVRGCLNHICLCCKSSFYSKACRLKKRSSPNCLTFYNRLRNNITTCKF